MPLGVTKLLQESEDIVRDSNLQLLAFAKVKSKYQLKTHLCWPQKQAGLINMIIWSETIADKI